MAENVPLHSKAMYKKPYWLVSVLSPTLRSLPNGAALLETLEWCCDIVYHNPQYNTSGLGLNAIIACALGIVGSSAFWLMFLLPSLWRFLVCVQFFAFFHMMEFLMISFCQNDLVHHQSFAIYHSKEFIIARIACVVEYFVLYLIFPDWANRFFWFSVICFLIAFAGQCLRSVAMFTCGKSFTHLVATELKNQHVLVTYGVYRYIRHPSYLGWYTWVILMQVGMLNPVCTLGFTYVVFRFFNERIRDEEEHLISFFGQDYLDYRESTPTYIPGIE